MIRTFISLDLPTSIRDEVEVVQSNLQSANHLDGAYTKKENIHLTLKFLGELNQDQIGEVKGRLSTLKFNPIDVELGHAGVFSPTDVKIVWVHLKGADDIQKQVDDSLKDLYQSEFRFMSHITLARVRSVDDKEKLLDYLNNLEIKPINESIKSIKLMKSSLTHDGPTYEVIEEYNAN